MHACSDLPLTHTSFSMVSSADSECAQALLELAMSNSPPCPSAESSGEDEASSIKRSIVEDPLVLAERAELLKRIKLDHCYYWVPENEAEVFRSYCDSIIQNGVGGNVCFLDTDDVDISFQRYPPKHLPGGRAGKENMADVAARLKAESLRREKKIALKGNVLHTKSLNLFGNPYEFEEEVTGSSSLSGEEDGSHAEGNNGLELLLRCLAADSQPSSHSGSDSHTSQDEGEEDSETESEDETGYRRQPDVEYEHKCRHCQKTFSKKRYLTKHVRRMHPDGMITSPEEVSTACPNCLKIISKRNFQRHLISCQFDLVACSLCGTHVRRENLARHKEKEHGIQRNVEFISGEHKLQQLADLVFMHSAKLKSTPKSSKSQKAEPKAVNVGKKKVVKKTPPNTKKTKSKTPKKVCPHGKKVKAKARTPVTALNGSHRLMESPENLSLESSESMFDLPEERVTMARGLVESPLPGTSRLGPFAPAIGLAPHSDENLRISQNAKSRNSLVVQAESSNGVKSKVILQPTRIKNMVSVTV